MITSCDPQIVHHSLLDTRYTTTSLRPWRQAWCNGVSPCSSLQVKLALSFSTSVITSWTLPLFEASISAVFWRHFKATGTTRPLTLIDLIYTLWCMAKQNRSCDLVINTTTKLTHPSSSILWLEQKIKYAGKYIRFIIWLQAYSESEPSVISKGSSAVDNCKLLT